jgi:hypothetical protein
MRTRLALVSTPEIDPIFAAIEQYEQAADAYWTEHAAAEERLGSRVWGGHPAVAGVEKAWRQATVALSATQATTIAGALALADLIAADCENIECDFGEGAEAVALAGNLRDSIAALAAQPLSFTHRLLRQ